MVDFDPNTRCPKTLPGSTDQCMGRLGHGQMAAPNDGPWEHVTEFGDGWDDTPYVKPSTPPVGGSGVTPPPGDRWRVTPAYRAMARADAVNAVAAGLTRHATDTGVAVWNAAAFDLADVLTEYILTGQRPE